MSNISNSKLNARERAELIAYMRRAFEYLSKPEPTERQRAQLPSDPVITRPANMVVPVTVHDPRVDVPMSMPAVLLVATEAAAQRRFAAARAMFNRR